MKALLSFFANEWYFAIPMVILLLVAFALVIWRWLLNMGANTNMDAFLPDLQTNLKLKGTKAALNLCKDEKGLIPKLLFVAGLEAHEQGVAAMRRSMASAVELEILPRLNYLLPLILAIAKIATMVGLLGTVISMINTFTAISETKSGSPTDVAGHAAGIGLALFATMFGLMTAIPLVFFHVMFKAWIANFELKMKASAQKLIVLVQNAKKPKSEKDDEEDEDEQDEEEDRRSRKKKSAR
jgi:biopolymer transport protein ExbB